MLAKRYILALCTVGLLWACTNPFTVRDAQPPRASNQPQDTNRLQTDPDSLFKKLQLAFETRNINFYRECLADSNQVGRTFRFVPEQNERDRLRGWSLQDESTYFSNLINQADLKSIQLTLSDKVSSGAPVSTTDTLQFQYRYKIELRFSNRREVYRGRANFDVLRSPLSLWYIFRWEDLPLSGEHSDSTWSTLKAIYRI